MREWAHDMKHVIGPVEAYAVLVARLVWHQFIAGAHAVFHVDNYGAMDAYIKGTSTNAQIRRILLAFEEAECLHHSWPWFSRVPSKSNCADDPSRGEVKGLVGPGFVRDSCLCPITGSLLADLP